MNEYNKCDLDYTRPLCDADNNPVKSKLNKNQINQGSAIKTV